MKKTLLALSCLILAETSASSVTLQNKTDVNAELSPHYKNGFGDSFTVNAKKKRSQAIDHIELIALLYWDVRSMPPKAVICPIQQYTDLSKINEIILEGKAPKYKCIIHMQ